MITLARIVINRSTNQLNRLFVYMVPAELGYIAVGTRVYVPIGRGKEEGIIIGYLEPEEYSYVQEADKYYLINYDGKKRVELKSIIKILDVDPWFTAEMIETAKRISQYYVCPLGEALNLFTINKKIDKGYERPKEVWLRYNGVEVDFGQKKVQKKLVEYLKTNGSTPIKKLKELGFSANVIKAARELGCLEYDERYVETLSKYEKKYIDKEIPLSPKQKEVYAYIQNSIAKKQYEEILLHGVTGSGKTQVYIKSVQKCIQSGKSAIVLVPEISLTYQIVKRFVEMFGDEVVVFHSQLTVNERYNNWERLRRGESHIIIGARSAVFAPLTDIGLIILDEEHDNSYKDWDNSHYHAKKVAAFRAEYHNCPLILGSATPAISTYYKALNKDIKLLELPERIHNNPLPEVNVVDMKEELFYGNKSVFSKQLYDLIKETLSQQKQMILLMNRRGYSTFVLCRECGQALMCPHCDTSLIYHRANEELKCHYCEYKQKVPNLCPKCGSKKIKFFGSGTQKVEEILQSEFAEARIARIDQDIKQKKGETDNIFEAFSQHKYDILLGTQMVSKGHDFEKVTAVGVITADSSLNIPSYTAAERTFSLLTQTAGRAGRGKYHGKVVIQTYNPAHYAIIYSKEHDYKKFYAEEIKNRHDLDYPPFKEMFHILISLGSQTKVRTVANRIVEELQRLFVNDSSDISVFGPYEDIIYKIQDKYRLLITVKGSDLTAIKKYIYTSWIFTIDGFSIIVDPI